MLMVDNVYVVDFKRKKVERRPEVDRPVWFVAHEEKGIPVDQLENCRIERILSGLLQQRKFQLSQLERLYCQYDAYKCSDREHLWDDRLERYQNDLHTTDAWIQIMNDEIDMRTTERRYI